MLGSNLGKKVDAQFMKNEYQTFLVKNHQQVQHKKQLTKEEKRAEFRKRGIFVAADDTEFDPTVFEKPSTISRPAVVKEDTKPLKWKRDEAHRKTTRTHHKPAEIKPFTNSEVTTSESKEDTGKSEKNSAAKTIKVIKATKNKPRTKPSKSGDVKKLPTVAKQVDVSVIKTKEVEKKAEKTEKSKIRKKKQEDQKDKSRKEKRVTEVRNRPVEEADKSARTARPGVVHTDDVTQKEGSSIRLAVEEADKSVRTARLGVVHMDDVTQNEEASIRLAVKERRTTMEDNEANEAAKDLVVVNTYSQEKVIVWKEDENKDNPVAVVAASQEKVIEIKDDDKKENPVAEPVQSQDKLSDDQTQQIITSPRCKSPPDSQHTWREPAHSEMEKKDDVFAKMEDYEEKHFDMNTAQLAAVDKKMVDMARRILKTAQRDKAFEKVLTPQENELLAKFFSGKIPYDAKVLKTLDHALDKTIDFLNSNKIKLDAEMQEMVEKRGILKAAMMEAMLSTPALLPQTWEKKYSELLEEAKKETNGINWFRILLCYPQQKSFDDGPEDQFGNFTRKKRHWLTGCIFGPSDSKSFLETKKEELSQGMFMDTSLIAKAKDPPSIHAEPLPRADTAMNSFPGIIARQNKINDSRLLQQLPLTDHSPENRAEVEKYRKHLQESARSQVAFMRDIEAEFERQQKVAHANALSNVKTTSQMMR